MTDSYSMDAFFISDGRSRRRRGGDAGGAGDAGSGVRELRTRLGSERDRRHADLHALRVKAVSVTIRGPKSGGRRCPALLGLLVLREEPGLPLPRRELPRHGDGCKPEPAVRTEGRERGPGGARQFDGVTEHPPPPRHPPTLPGCKAKAVTLQETIGKTAPPGAPAKVRTSTIRADKDVSVCVFKMPRLKKKKKKRREKRQ